VRSAGNLLIALSAIVVLVAFALDTSVHSYGGEVNNIGLLQRQMMVLHVGLALAIVGAVLSGAGAVAERLAPGEEEKPAAHGLFGALPPRDEARPEETRSPEEIARARKRETLGYLFVAALIVALVVGAVALKPRKAGPDSAVDAVSNAADSNMMDDVDLNVEAVNVAAY
jgi:hypothetical protein